MLTALIELLVSHGEDKGIFLVCWFCNVELRIMRKSTRLRYVFGLSLDIKLAWQGDARFKGGEGKELLSLRNLFDKQIALWIFILFLDN